jgi:hypothetical protein
VAGSYERTKLHGVTSKKTVILLATGHASVLTPVSAASRTQGVVFRENIIGHSVV